MKNKAAVVALISVSLLFLGLVCFITITSYFNERNSFVIYQNNIIKRSLQDGLRLGYQLRKPNNAPIIQINASLCESSKMWGNPHAGGWMICLDEFFLDPKNCVVYSFGLGADWSFDSMAEQYGCHVHGFDPTGLLWRQGMHGSSYANVDYKLQYPSAKKEFHNWGLGSAEIATYSTGGFPQEWPGLGDPALSKANPEPWEMKSIKQTLADLKHNESGISILKVDVEGSEWIALAAMLNDLSAPRGDSVSVGSPHSSTTPRRKEHINLPSLLLHWSIYLYFQFTFLRSGLTLNTGLIKQLLVEWHWDPDSRFGLISRPQFVPTACSLRLNFRYCILKLQHSVGFL